MQTKNTNVSKAFFLSGTLFFMVLALLLVTKEIWPFVQDEWRNYLRSKESAAALDIKEYRIYKNDLYKAQDTQKAVLNKDYEYERNFTYTAWTAEWLNTSDSIVYLRHNNFTNMIIAEAPHRFSSLEAMPFPRDVLTGNFTFRILEHGKQVATFSNINLKKLSQDNSANDKKELRLISDDKKIILYAMFDTDEFQ